MQGKPLYSNRRADWSAVLFALVFPTLVTWVYFVWLKHHPASLQQTAYSIGKLLQFAFPVLWVVLIQYRRVTTRWCRQSDPTESRRQGLLRNILDPALPLSCLLAGRRLWAALRRPSAKGLGWGLLTGVAIILAMLLLYYAFLKPQGHFDGALGPIRDKVQGFGLDRLWKYAALGVFYALAHSFLEEYYWRWFVFGQLRRLIPPGAAVFVSSLGFTAHHIILLSAFFGWGSFASLFFSFAVFVGGVIWAWLYHRSGSLYGPWLSHALVDAGIFLVGYDVVRDMF